MEFPAPKWFGCFETKLSGLLAMFGWLWSWVWVPRFHESGDFVRVCWGVRFNFSEGAPDVSLCLEGFCDDFCGKFRIQPVASRFPLLRKITLIWDCFRLCGWTSFCDFCIFLEFPAKPPHINADGLVLPSRSGCWWLVMSNWPSSRGHQWNE